MKSLRNGELLRPRLIAKIVICLVVVVAFYHIGKQWSRHVTQLVFYTPRQTSPVAISPNFNASFNVSYIIAVTSPSPPPPPPPPPESEKVKRFGIVDQNGTMSDDFEVGEFDPADVVENWDENGTEIASEESGDSSRRVKLTKFAACPGSKSEYIPCLDNEEAIRQLKSIKKGEKFERHCPEPDRGVDCLVRPPKKYKRPIPWPQSRDEVFSLSFLAIFSASMTLDRLKSNKIRDMSVLNLLCSVLSVFVVFFFFFFWRTDPN